MIKLIKGDRPQVLEDNGASWTAALVAKLTNGLQPTDTEKSRYRHPDIKSALVSETNAKCAYCESKLLHVTYGDVEHIVPKSPHPHKSFEWENLTLACDVCNTKKGDKLDVIDPYDTDPNEQFFVYGAFVMPKPDSEDAIYSEKILGLNRTELLEMREKRIKQLHDLVCLYQASSNPKTKAAIRQDIIDNETSSSVEYTAISRKYVEDMIRDGRL